MANWLLRLFENTSINEVWIALSLNGLIAFGILVVISFAVARGNHTKRKILSCSIIGACISTIWIIITAQVLLFLSQGVIAGTEQGNWIFVLRLFGFSQSLIGEPVYSNVMQSIYRFAPKSHSFNLIFLPSYVLVFISGFLGCLVMAVSLLPVQNKDKIPSRLFLSISALIGFAFIFTGFSISVFYQATVLVGG